ncbi:hypothetical protein DW657_11450 [Prevotella sp. AM23-5]|nr:hypothetical protein DW657_11450 [Prevotella sp. AM23-5]
MKLASKEPKLGIMLIKSIVGCICLRIIANSVYMDKLDKIKELNTQYKLLRNNGMVVEVKLLTNIGDYSIKNPNVISKVLDLLILESQKQIESEVNK